MSSAGEPPPNPFDDISRDTRIGDLRRKPQAPPDTRLGRVIVIAFIAYAAALHIVAAFISVRGVSAGMFCGWAIYAYLFYLLWIGLNLGRAILTGLYLSFGGWWIYEGILSGHHFWTAIGTPLAAGALLIGFSPAVRRFVRYQAAIHSR